MVELLFLLGKSYRICLCLLISCLLNTSASWGQSLSLSKEPDNLSTRQADSIELFAELIPGKVKNNTAITLKLWGRVAEGFHIYSIYPQGQFAPEPTQLLLENGYLHTESKLMESEPTWVQDQSFGERLKVHKNDFWLAKHYRLKKNYPPGSYLLKGSLFYQVCNNKICSLPLTKGFSVRLEVIGNKSK